MAGDPVYFEGISSERPCETAHEAPICVAKAWAVCTDLGGASCTLIGLPEKPLVSLQQRFDEYAEDYIAPYRSMTETAIEKPWTLSFSDILLVTNQYDPSADVGLTAIKPVESKRFGRSRQIPPGFDGAVEVAMYTNVADEVTNHSLFVKKMDGQWRVIGQHHARTHHVGGYYGADMDNSGWREWCDKAAANQASTRCAMFVYGLRPFDSIRIRHPRVE